MIEISLYILISDDVSEEEAVLPHCILFALITVSCDNLNKYIRISCQNKIKPTFISSETEISFENAELNHVSESSLLYFFKTKSIIF